MLAKLARWLIAKFAGAVLIVGLGLVAIALWLYLNDKVDFEQQRVEHLQQLATERGHLREARAQVEQRLAQISHELQGEERRIEEAKKIVASLRDLESWWDRWFGNRAQQSANARQIERMEQMQSETKELITGLNRRMAQATWERDGVDAALSRLEAEVHRVEENRSMPRHYLDEAWERSHWILAAALVLLFLGPVAWALLLYYGFAAVTTRGRPLRLTRTLAALPAVGESQAALVVPLAAGDVMRVRRKFLTTSPDGSGRKAKLVLDWRIPFTSLACGLFNLVELRGEGTDTAHGVALSDPDDPQVRLTAIEVPAGSALILRPRFLAGVIRGREERLRIKRHWHIARWQSWVTGQFRYFEFVGPCRLVVAARRGVRPEVLADREGGKEPAHRANQDAMIGFTPNLDYKLVRAPTFWSYHRGLTPLFDDLFAGRGVLVLQESPGTGSNADDARFRYKVWHRIRKVFGV